MAKSAEELLIFLFDEILPSHGMALRVRQKELSLEMLRALQEDKLALCEAEVGTGKTHAYILALTVHNLYSDKKAPAVISTRASLRGRYRAEIEMKITLIVAGAVTGALIVVYLLAGVAAARAGACMKAME